jgi:3'-5' exoribonuclease
MLSWSILVGVGMYKKQKSISEYKPSEDFKDIFVVRFTKGPYQTKRGTYYLEIKVQDAVGEAILKYWGSEDVQKIEELLKSLEEDSVIFAEGRVSEYNGKIDFSVNEGNLKTLKDGEYDISDFIRCSERDADKMFNELEKYIKSVKNSELQKVLDAFFSDKEFVEKFKKSPAAMYIHHGWVSGLLEHTLTVLNICMDVARHHKDIDRDLLVTGAILHDIGKISEFVVSTQIRVSDKGNLLSHLILGIQKLTRVLDKLDISEETKNKLLHIIVSHHGKIENGCPKIPMFPEALIIAKADDLDSSLVEMVDTKKNAQTTDSFIYNRRLGNIYLK